MTPKKDSKKLPMTTKCGIALFLFILAVVAAFLVLNALSQIESIDLPIIFAYIPLGIAALATIITLCILAGFYTPKKSRYVILQNMMSF